MQLKEARKKADIKQTELADKLGVNQSIISFIESGEIYPTAVQQIRINKAVGCDIDWSKHPNAPLTANENEMFQKLYQISCEVLGGEKTAIDFLNKQSPASLRKLFRLAGVDTEVKPLSVNGYPQQMVRQK
ncbi:MAG: hypothetical protein AVO38_11010 [delta proteobacterium ML8_D]|nr:MAG: hypothetical protein AVO34_05400 [Firmicutes bacterium ML8_F2]OPL15116.1 MAG: hypothetical protein AVO38_11010 [delta proteobacterium ML8_D]